MSYLNLNTATEGDDHIIANYVSGVEPIASDPFVWDDTALSSVTIDITNGLDGGGEVVSVGSKSFSLADISFTDSPVTIATTDYLVSWDVSTQKVTVIRTAATPITPTQVGELVVATTYEHLGGATGGERRLLVTLVDPIPANNSQASCYIDVLPDAGGGEGGEGGGEGGEGGADLDLDTSTEGVDSSVAYTAGAAPAAISGTVAIGDLGTLIEVDLVVSGNLDGADEVLHIGDLSFPLNSGFFSTDLNVGEDVITCDWESGQSLAILYIAEEPGIIGNDLAARIIEATSYEHVGSTPTEGVRTIGVSVFNESEGEFTANSLIDVSAGVAAAIQGFSAPYRRRLHRY